MSPHQPRSPMPAPGACLKLTLWCLVLGWGLWYTELWAKPQSPLPPTQADAAAQMRAGANYFQRGRFDSAVVAWAEAARIYKASKDQPAHGQALLRKGEAYLALGRYPDAIRTLKASLELAEESGATVLAAQAMGSLGSAHFLAGHSEKAVGLLNASLDASRALDEPNMAAITLNDLGTLLASRGAIKDATTIYRQGLALAHEMENQPLVARISTNLARALVQGGRLQEAREMLDLAMTEIRALDASHAKAFALISLGRLYQRSGALPEEEIDSFQRIAADAYKEAAIVAHAVGDRRALSYAAGYLGELYEGTGRHDESLVLTERAVYAAQLAGAPEALYRWQWQTGRLLRIKANLDNAVGAYQRAVYTLQSIRQELSHSSTASTVPFKSRVGRIYLELADLLLERAGTAGDQERMEAALKDAREAVEMLKGAELENYYQDDCVAALRSKTTGIDQLAPKTAALYPIIFDDRLELLLTLPDGMKRFTTKVSAEVLTAELRSLRRRLEKRTTGQYLRHAGRVYDWLIRPLKAALDRHGIETLVIVPDGALRTIPIAALHDGKEFLVAKYAVATTPGLTLTDPRPIERTGVKVLTSGLTESVQGFPALPDVADELANIQSYYGGTVLKDQDFIVSKVERELAKTPYSIVHIASHGQFSSDVSETFLLTYDSKLDMDALEQYMGMTTYREQPVELLALSACQTAAGDDRAALGLAGIAVKAGARSALATLWFVNDRASSMLVSEFYRQLRDPSLSKAKALRQAQLALLKDRRYEHPAYWSPFLLIGNWL